MLYANYQSKKDQTQKHMGVLMSPELHLINTIMGHRATSYTSSVVVERNAVVQLRLTVLFWE